MLPVLLNLPVLKIYTLGVFLVLAFFWSSFMLWRNIRLTTYKEDEIFDGVFFMLFGGLFLGRLFYVIPHFNDFGFSILKFILINGYPGMALYGCIFGSLISLWLYFSYKKIKFFDAIDYFIPGFLLALAIGKLGSFFSGAEIGAKTTFFLALKYSNTSGFRHLTALYESILFFAGAFIAYKLLFEIRRDKYRKGFLFFFYMWYVSLITFIFDPLKTNVIKAFGVSMNFVTAGVILLTFSIYLVYYFRSLLKGKTFSFKNYFSNHGKSIHRRIHSKSKKETPSGQDNNSEENTGTTE